MWEHLSSEKIIEGHHLQTTMSVEFEAYDGRSEVLPLFASANQIRSMKIMLGSTMVELSTTHEANWSTSFDAPLQRQQDPTPPLSSATRAVTGTTEEVATVENQEAKKQEEPKKKHDKHEKWATEMRNLLIAVATVFATMTYQAGLTPPGGFWSEEDQSPSRPSCSSFCATNATTPYPQNTTIVCIPSSDMAAPSPSPVPPEPGYPILESTNPERYNGFKIANTIAFVYSMAAIVLLLSNRLYSVLEGRIELKGIMVFNAFLIAFAYSAGYERDHSISIGPLSAIVFIYILDYVAYKINKKIFKKVCMIGNLFKKYCINGEKKQSGDQKNVEA